MQSLNALVGRFGLSLIFILSGIAKISAFAGTQQYMASAGVPGFLLPLVIALEVGGGLAILAGAFTRSVAIALALFSVASAILFHGNLGDQNQFIHFMKNVAIAGGFLVLAANGAGPISIDALRRKKAVASTVPVVTA
jgi:putative oxidoreductase